MTNSYYAQDRKRYTKYGKLQWHEPSFWAVTVYRLGQWCQLKRDNIIRKTLYFVYLPIYALVTMITGINIPPTTKIGPGLRIWHFGCIVLHPDVVIGANCDLRHDVTIGNRREYDDVPVIGDNVSIGAGARILGKIKVGDDVMIGANAVVLSDVPSNHIAVGNPARHIYRRLGSER